MSLLKVKKRNGLVTDFDTARIALAVQRAIQSTPNVDVSTNFHEEITERVMQDLDIQFRDTEEIPSVEQIQDLVERALVESGNFEIAKHYILYRAERARVRAEARLEELQKLEKNLLKVVTSSGKMEPFVLAKIKAVVSTAAKRHHGIIDENLVLSEVKKNIFDGISTTDISRVLVMAGKSFIERDPAYSKFCADLLISMIYREVANVNEEASDFENAYQKSFGENLKEGVLNERIDSELLNFNIDRLAKELKPERDHFFTYLGLQTLYDRYFIHVGGRRIETPQYFWMRVAMGLALQEKAEERETRAIEFYNTLSQLHFVSSTPTLFNSGTIHSQLSSCYLSTVKDDLHHIFKVIADNAQLSKWAGGLGNDWTNVRATGAPIKGTNGKSQGLIPFLKIVNDTALAVNQGGKRKGAVAAYLECWHFDFEEFLELRRNTGDERRRTHDMNTAAWVPDLFMQRVQEDKDWTLFSPDEVPELHHIYGKNFREKYEHYEKMIDEGKIHVWKKIPAQKLWKKMITMLFETGHPWITFKDPCNIRSPQDHCGVVHDSNLCTEITLNNSAEETAVCNLGSINLAQHYDPTTNSFDREKLSQTIKTAIRMLDNVVDINYYPTPETKTSNLCHRPIGLGIMGFHDLLYRMNLDFASDVAVDFSDEVMEFVSYHAVLSSSNLAGDRGAYKSFKDSKWDRGLLPIDTVDLLETERGEPVKMNRVTRMDWNPVREAIKKNGMRNSNTMAIAPTATIANIAGCIPCIEPIYKNLYVKSNMGGEFMVINQYLVEDLKKEGLWNTTMCQMLKAHDGSVQNIEDIPLRLREKYKEIFEIGAGWIVRHASMRQKWIDQAQSVNIFYRGTSGKEIADVYMDAWKSGLKTTYYLRTLGATQVQKSTVNVEMQKISQHQNQETKKEEAVDSATSKETEMSAEEMREKKINSPFLRARGLSSATIAAMTDGDCEACQ